MINLIIGRLIIIFKNKKYLKQKIKILKKWKEEK